MTEIETPAADAPAAPVDDPDRIRVCSLSGTLGAAAILVAFFLPWVEIEPSVAERYAERVDARIEDPVRGPPAWAEDWRGLARLVTEQQYVSGLDVFWWARTAVRPSGGTLADGGKPPPPTGETAQAKRTLRVVMGWLAALPILSLLLFVYFIVHHCRRAKSPALILAMLTGAAAVISTALYGILRPVFRDDSTIGMYTSPGVGLKVLLVGGAILFLAGSFGVRARNWWRVFGGAIIVGGFVALGLLGYIRGVSKL